MIEWVGQALDWLKSHDVTEGILVLQTIILGAQVLISRKQARISDAQTKIARDAFFATSRPRVVVRAAVFEKRLGDDALVVTYSIANVGGTKAEIVEMYFVMRRWRRGMAPTDVEQELKLTRLERPFRLAPGESQRREAANSLEPDEISRILDRLELERASSGTRPAEHDLIFCGTLVHVDDRGVRRRTSAWRIRDTGSSSMVPVEDQEYDFAD